MLIFLLSLTAMLLFWEYRFFCYQSQKMVALQQHYYSYIAQVKKSLRHNKQYNGSDEGNLCGLDVSEGNRIVSREENDELLNDSFMIINRAPEYLKESTLDYLKQQRLESLLKDMNLHDWQDYTDQLLIQDDVPAVPSKQTTKSGQRKPSTYSKSPAKVRARRIGLFAWPIERSQFWLSSLFGPRKKPNGSGGFHYGLDMAAPRSTAVHAAAAGRVEQAGYVSGYGNTILIAHDATYKTRYAHLDAIYVKAKQWVKLKAKIGAVGDTGFTLKSGTDASHLHFEVYKQGKQVNPLYLLPSR